MHCYQANSNTVMASYPDFVREIFSHRFGISKPKKNYSTDFQGRLFDAAGSHRSIKSVSDEHNGAVYRHQERINLIFVHHQLADKVSRTQRTITEYFDLPKGHTAMNVKALEASWGPVKRLLSYSTGTIDSFDANDPTLSTKAFSDILCACMSSLRPRLQVALLINVALHAVSLGADHTFKIMSKGSGADVYGAMLTIRSNASGAVVSFFVESTGMADVGQQLRNIALLNDALQESNLRRVASLFQVPMLITSLACPFDRFAATYLRHCKLLVLQDDGLYLAVDGDFKRFAALALKVTYLDNCCQARSAVQASCPQLFKYLPLKQQLEAAPVLPKVILIEPLKTPEKEPPQDVQCGFTFQAPQACCQADESALDRLLAKPAIAFDLEWDTGSGDITAFIVAGVVVLDGVKANAVFVINTYGAQPASYDLPNTVLSRIKTAFQDQVKLKYGFCISNDLKKLRHAGFTVADESFSDLNDDPKIRQLRAPKGKGANRLNVLAMRASEELVKTKTLKHAITIPKGSESTSFNQAVFSPSMMVYAGCDGAATHILAAYAGTMPCCWAEYDQGLEMREATAAESDSEYDSARQPAKLDHFHAVRLLFIMSAHPSNADI